MICEATYTSFEAIPETLREEFEQVSGKWQLKQSAIPGVGPLFNSALAANEAKAVGQVKTRNERIRVLEEENNQIKDKLAVLDSPGNKVLSKADADTFDAYAKLGTPTEIKTKLDKLPEMEGKVLKFETSESLVKVTKANGLGETTLNPEVLSDWLASEENKGVKVFVKTEERLDAKNQKVSVEVPYLRIEKLENGQTTVTEKELLPFAKENMLGWKYDALVAGTPSDTDKGKQQLAPNTGGNGSGVRVPNLGSARQEPTEEKAERPVDKFNKARAAKPNPFTKSPTGVMAGGIPIVR